MSRVYSQEIRMVFEYAYGCVNSPSDTSHLFVGDVNSVFAKNVLQSFKAPASDAPAHDSDRELRGNSLIHESNRERMDSNDAVFGDTLDIIIPVITREQNIIMDMFGSELIKKNISQWQEDLGCRTRGPVKEQKAKRSIR
jgi:hypothetical protein